MDKWLERLPPPVGRPLAFPYHLGRFALHLVKYIYVNVVAPFLVAPPAVLYVLHGWHQFPATYLLSQRYGAPVIYDAHDFYPGIIPPEHLPAYTKNWERPFRRWIESLCMRYAAAVLTVSDGLAGLHSREFQRQSLTLRNCHDARLDEPCSDTLRRLLGLPAEVFLLVVIGHAKEGQAIREAITALARLPDHVHMAFVGRNYETRLEAALARGLGERVHNIGAVHVRQVVPFVQDADASLILYYPYSSNYQHSLPNGLFQSIAAGLPVLYPGLADIRRLAQQHRFGIEIDPRDPASIAGGVSQLLDPKLRKKIKRDVKTASVALSWEREEVVLREVITGVLGRQKSPTVSGRA